MRFIPPSGGKKLLAKDTVQETLLLILSHSLYRTYMLVSLG